MNSIRLLNKAKLAYCLLQPRFSIYSNLHNRFFSCIGKKVTQSPPLNVSYKHVKYISNCNSMLTSDSDSSENKNDSDKFQNILEDKEFQSILQDFAKDFEVDSDSNQLLEDIRKDIDASHRENDVLTENHSKEDVSPSDSRFQFKYKDFSDSDSSVIPSYEEQYDPFEDSDETYHIDQELKPKSSYSDLKRGISGVFDLDELVDVLRNESLLDVTSISIPKELHYSDFLVLVTAKSERHSEAVAELIVKLYKQKKNKMDPFIKVEGGDVANWKAIDMGNIVLHIFMEETRTLYDIESLWLFDSTFDSGGNMQPDPMLNILEEQIEFFNSLQQPQSSSSKDVSEKEPESP